MHEQEVENYLDSLDLRPIDRGRYWLIRCPRHEDKQPSAQCFKDDGFIECHAGCGRFNINEVAKERGDPLPIPFEKGSETRKNGSVRPSKPKKEPAPIRGDFTDMWFELEPLEPNMDVKGVSGMELNKRGWRKFPGGNGLHAGIFIPYFNPQRTKVLFYQIRHLSGERRFTFAPKVTPIVYGMEVLPSCTRFLCVTEGSRDSVILRMAGLPAVALPSASSDKLLEGLCSYCMKNGLTMIWVGDKDEAGESLMAKASCPMIDYRTPVGKDIGDFYEDAGLEAIKEHYKMFI